MVDVLAKRARRCRRATKPPGAHTLPACTRCASRGERVTLGGKGPSAVMLAFVVAGVSLMLLAALCACAPRAVVDEASPRQRGVQVAAGSELTEASQYVEVRVEFGAPLEAASSGSVADDFEVLVNGEEPDSRCMQVEAGVEGSQVVVRLVPTGAASEQKNSVYYALYDGLVEVSPRSGDGALAHVLAQGSTSNAVMDAAPVRFTVPSGVQVALADDAVGAGGGADAEGTGADADGAQVSFDIVQTARLRSCTWFSFGEGLPAVRLHNHEFTRDLPQTCAERLASTINEVYGDSLAASSDGARVTVCLRDVGEARELHVAVVEGLGAFPAQDGASSPGSDA